MWRWPPTSVEKFTSSNIWIRVEIWNLVSTYNTEKLACRRIYRCANVHTYMTAPMTEMLSRTLVLHPDTSPVEIWTVMMVVASWLVNCRVRDGSGVYIYSVDRCKCYTTYGHPKNCPSVRVQEKDRCWYYHNSILVETSTKLTRDTCPTHCDFVKLRFSLEMIWKVPNSLYTVTQPHLKLYFSFHSVSHISELETILSSSGNPWYT